MISSLFTHIKSDAKGGMVAFLVALPLCLGIALASGAPLFSGIIAGVIGGIVVGSLSGSALSVSGPAAGLTAIVLGAIEKLGHYETFLLAVVLAGVFQLILGLLKAGSISNYFPSSVIKGMLAAIGLTLILKQIPHALGYDKDAEGESEFLQADGENTFTEILQAIQHPDAGAIIIAVVSMIVLLLWDKPFLKKYSFFKTVPSALIVVIIGIVFHTLYNLFLPGLQLSENHLVNLPIAKGLNSFFALFTLPDFTQLGNTQVYISAFTIAIVASLETLLNVEATDKLDPLKRNTPPNRELKAQGVGNIVSGLIGGLPVTSVVVRSTASIMAGSRTKMAAILHAILLFACVILIPSFLNRIPLACLAAILLFTGYKLAKISIFKDMYQLGIDQFIPFVVTIVAILFSDLLIGIAIGMVVGVFFILKANFKTSHFFHKQIDKEHEFIKINLSENVSFLNKASIINILENLPEHSSVQIDGSKSTYIDYDVLEVIENFRETAKLKNINLTFLPQGSSAVNNSNHQADEKTEIHLPIQDQTDYLGLFENNRDWVTQKLQSDPRYFKELAKGQSPRYLFISCSDSRISASDITGTNPGEMFVHRNVANLVVSTDMNFLSVLQYAVEVLKVKHIIVCGHYGCGGVKAAMGDQDLGLINKWLCNIKDVYRLHKAELDAITYEEARFKKLVELNVIEQVCNLHKTSIVQKAWSGDASVHVHGWVYDLAEGFIKDLEIDVQKAFKDYNEVYRFSYAKELPLENGLVKAPKV
ncbi:MAG: SulP family inorganic anion transporter [Bacteroidota bacterium]